MTVGLFLNVKMTVGLFSNDCWPFLQAHCTSTKRGRWQWWPYRLWLILTLLIDWDTHWSQRKALVRLSLYTKEPMMIRRSFCCNRVSSGGLTSSVVLQGLPLLLGL